MARSLVLLVCCLFLFAGCAHHTAQVASVASPAGAIQGKKNANAVKEEPGIASTAAKTDHNKRLLHAFRNNHGQVRLVVESSESLSQSTLRQAFSNDFDAFYLLLKAVPESVVSIEVAAASRAEAQAQHIADFIVSNCNIAPPRIQVKNAGITLEKGALAAIVVSMPHVAPIAPSVLAAVKEEAKTINASTEGAARHNAPAVTADVAASDTLTFTFNSGRSRVQEQLSPAVAAIARRLQENQTLNAVIEGHTDNVGERENNELLSYQRALAVQIALIKDFGISPDRMEVIGKGELDPVASNATKEGRSLNRRVVVRFKEAPTPVVVANAPESKNKVRRSTLRVANNAPAIAAKNQNAAMDLASIPKAHVTYEQLGPVSQRPKKYKVEISVSKCTLWLYEILSDGSKRLVRPFQVATAKPGTPWPSGTGMVMGIDYDPWWYPTQNMKSRARQIGKRLVPVAPGAPNNPMGAVKIILSHANNGGGYRIHGTNRPSMIGKRVSLGCIRMFNDDGIELARTIPVGTEVDIHF